MRLPSAFSGIRRLGFDASPIIYYVEHHPRYDALVATVFAAVDRGDIQAIASVVNIVEVLTQPLATHHTVLANKYRDILLSSESFTTFTVTPDIAEAAAGLRAQYGLRTPDALQIATALAADCDAFLTNDARLRRVTDLRILVLEDLVA